MMILIFATAALIILFRDPIRNRHTKYTWIIDFSELTIEETAKPKTPSTVSGKILSRPKLHGGPLTNMLVFITSK